MAYLKRSTGTIVKSTAAELNILDGVTSTAAELNLLDGKTGIPDEVVLQRKFTKTNQQGHLLFTGSSGWSRHPKYNNVEFSFTPKQTASKLILEYNYGLAHCSSGSYGYAAFTKGGNRSTWVNGAGETGYSDSYGHFSCGPNSTNSGYHPVHGVFVSENNSTSQFTFGLYAKWSAGNWYYAHDGSHHILSITEILN